MLLAATTLCDCVSCSSSVVVTVSDCFLDRLCRFTCEADRDNTLPFTWKSYNGPLRHVLRSLTPRANATMMLCTDRHAPTLVDWSWCFSTAFGLRGVGDAVAPPDRTACCYATQPLTAHVAVGVPVCQCCGYLTELLSQLHRALCVSIVCSFFCVKCVAHVECRHRSSTRAVEWYPWIFIAAALSCPISINQSSEGSFLNCHCHCYDRCPCSRVVIVDIVVKWPRGRAVVSAHRTAARR